MKPYVWKGRHSRKWFVDSGKPAARIIGNPWGYLTWREAYTAALASLAGEPTA